MKISVKQFALDCGISRAMLYNHIADGAVEKDGRGIDTDNEKNADFLASQVRKQIREGKKTESEVHREGDTIVIKKVIRKKPRGLALDPNTKEPLPKGEKPKKSKPAPEDKPKKGKRNLGDVVDAETPEEKGTPPLTQQERINLKMSEVKLAKILGKVVATDMITETLQTLPKLLASRHHSHISDIVDELGAEFKLDANRKRAIKTAALERTNHDSAEALAGAEKHINALIDAYSEKKGL
jgi:hypothetical protein